MTDTQYRAIFQDETGRWLPATDPTTHAKALREVDELVAAGFSAMVESIATSKHIAKRARERA